MRRFAQPGGRVAEDQHPPFFAQRPHRAVPEVAVDHHYTAGGDADDLFALYRLEDLVIGVTIEPGVRAGNDTDTVSYTHLTLPTKRIV